MTRTERINQYHRLARLVEDSCKLEATLTQVIRTHWVEEAQTRTPTAECLKQPGVIALDFGLTSDKHGLAVRFGFAVREVDEWLPADRPDDVTLQAVDRALDVFEQYGRRVRFVVGDSNGVGRGAMETLTRYFRERPELGVTVVHFNSGAGARDAKRYHRARDEMWFKRGRAFFADPRCALVAHPGLKKQLTTPGYAEGADRRIKVESKADILRRTGEPSGNAADAVLMTLVVNEAQEAPKPAAEPDSRPKVFRDHFAWLKRQREGQAGYLIA